MTVLNFSSTMQPSAISLGNNFNHLTIKENDIKSLQNKNMHPTDCRGEKPPPRIAVRHSTSSVPNKEGLTFEIAAHQTLEILRKALDEDTFNRYCTGDIRKIDAKKLFENIDPNAVLKEIEAEAEATRALVTVGNLVVQQGVMLVGGPIAAAAVGIGIYVGSALRKNVYEKAAEEIQKEQKTDIVKEANHALTQTASSSIKAGEKLLQTAVSTSSNVPESTVFSQVVSKKVVIPIPDSSYGAWEKPVSRTVKPIVRLVKIKPISTQFFSDSTWGKVSSVSNATFKVAGKFFTVVDHCTRALAIIHASRQIYRYRNQIPDVVKNMLGIRPGLDLGLWLKVNIERLAEQRLIPLKFRKDEELIKNFCLLSGSPIRHPVRAPDGLIYERHAIEAWLQNRPTSPYDYSIFIRLEDLQPDHELEGQIIARIRYLEFME